MFKIIILISSLVYLLDIFEQKSLFRVQKFSNVKYCFFDACKNAKSVFIIIKFASETSITTFFVHVGILEKYACNKIEREKYYRTDCFFK